METIQADGYWKDDGQKFYGKRLALGDWDGLEDDKDQEIFYYLDGVPALGDHGDFVITHTY